MPQFCKMFNSLLTTVKSKVKILQNFVAFSEYMNLKTLTFDFDKKFRGCLLQSKLYKSSDATSKKP